MSTTNPCCHDCTDFTDDPALDTGCCTPLPVRRECGAPALPVPACDEVAPITEYDPETEQFTVLTILYDSECSALLDSASSPLLSLIA